jgi:hypothetical protein
LVLLRKLATANDSYKAWQSAHENFGSYSIATIAVCKYSIAMQVEIQPLRINGFKMPTRSHGADTLLRGELIIGHHWLSKSQTRLAAQLRKPGVSISGDEYLLAVLYEPQIKGWRGAGFGLTGWEILDWKSDGRQIVLQEWACWILGF